MVKGIAGLFGKSAQTIATDANTVALEENTAALLGKSGGGGSLVADAFKYGKFAPAMAAGFALAALGGLAFGAYGDAALKERGLQEVGRGISKRGGGYVAPFSQAQNSIAQRNSVRVRVTN